MEILRILKDCWETCVSQGAEDAIVICEKEIKEHLQLNYDVNFCELNRLTRELSFNFDLEEIIL